MIQYSEDYIVPLIFRINGSVGVRSCMFAIPAAVIALIMVFLDDAVPSFREDIGLLDLKYSQLWTASTGVLGILLGFRTNRAMARFWEGTGLLHQMRGEWFDSVSCCVTFSRAAVFAKREDVMAFRHTIVRLMSLCHGSALEEIAGSDAEECETIDSFGLDNTTLQHLKECKDVYDFNRVEVLLHLIQSLITKNLDDGILKIPPPILSRVYQTLSRGFVNLLNAKKIADTRFPFPYVQLITILLILHIFMTPLMISSLLPSKAWAPIFTFVPIFGMFSLNFIGVELENPFGNDANDLPLDHFQAEMNKCLMMLLQDNADLIAGVSKTRCMRNYDDIAATLHGGHPQEGAHVASAPTKRLSRFSDFVDTEADDCSEVGSNNGAPAATKVAPSPAPPPPANPPTPEPKKLPPDLLTNSISEFEKALQDLKRSVEGQMSDLSRSISAVKDFGSTLPALLHTLDEARSPMLKLDAKPGETSRQEYVLMSPPTREGTGGSVASSLTCSGRSPNKPVLPGPTPSVQVQQVRLDPLDCPHGA